MGISKNSRMNKNRTLMTQIKRINTDFISENQSHQCYLPKGWLRLRVPLN